MKRILVSMLLGSAVLAAPLIASAQAYPTTTWSSRFQQLPLQMSGGQTPEPVPLVKSDGITPDGAGGAATVALPFDFRFFGTSYNEIKVGAKGYITFGAAAPTSTAVSNFTNLTAPANLIAAWWGNHTCDLDDGGVQTQLVGTAPQRIFVIQWKDCRGLSGTTATDTRFAAQIWLYEGSEPNNVFRISYREAYVEPGKDWGQVAWGYKGPTGAGVMGPDKYGVDDVCRPIAVNPKPACRAALHFPEHTTTQYGHFDLADLSASIAVDADDLTVRPGEISLETTVTLRNGGNTDVSNATYDIYLSEVQQISLGTGVSHKVFSHAAPVFVDGPGSITVEDSFTSTNRPKNGMYYVCVLIDPLGVINEADRGNNTVCTSNQVGIGPDLTGKVIPPTSAMQEEALTFSVIFYNIGNEDVDTPFDFEVWVVPDPQDIVELTEISLSEELLFAGTVNERIPRRVGDVDGIHPVPVGADPDLPPVYLPDNLRGRRYSFRLKIDVTNVIEESNEHNNNVVSDTMLIHRMPNLKVSPNITVTMPYGCYYGQPVHATVEICNSGPAPAKNFRPGFVLGDGDNPSLSYDAAAASYPAKCYETVNEYTQELDRNQVGCEPFLGMEAFCMLNYCQIECQVDADCGDPRMVCGVDVELNKRMPGVKTCMNYIAGAPTSTQPVCQTYEVTGRFPLAQETDGKYYQFGSQYFHFIHDLDDSVNQPAPSVQRSEELECNVSLPDLVTTSMSAPNRIKAGEPTSVQRVIKNLGFTAFPRPADDHPAEVPLDPAPEFIDVTYGYYLASSQDISIHQIPVEVQSTGGPGVSRLGTIKNLQNESSLTDRIVVPALLEEGTYYLGLIVDPFGEFEEWDKENNVYVYPTPIVVQPSSLQIVTDPLPTAVLGAKLVYDFDATGGTGKYRWSARNLPPGLSFSEQGRLSGAPLEVGEFYFDVRVSSGELSMEKPFILRVVAPQASLEITTTSLPFAIAQTPYGGWVDEDGQPHLGVQLTASGGTPPYTWDEDGRLASRNGWNLSPEGILTGTVTINLESRAFTAIVRDVNGNTASAELWINVLKGKGNLMITSTRFSGGTAAVRYSSFIEASGLESDDYYVWEVDASTIPPGLSATYEGRRMRLEGIPTQCANYTVKVTVRDDEGQQNDSASLPLSIECDSTTHVNNGSLPNVSREEVVEIQLGSNAGANASFRLYQGTLPDGLSLARDGLITGTVSKDAAFGTYNFIVEVSTPGGNNGRSPLALTVRTDVRKPIVEVVKEPRCSSVGGGAADTAAFGLVMLGLALFGRRPKRG